MSTNGPTTEEIDALIAEGERVCAELEAALVTHDRSMAEQKLDAAACLAYVRRNGGERAVQAIEHEVAATLQGIHEQVECLEMHAAKPRLASHRARVRPDLV